MCPLLPQKPRRSQRWPYKYRTVPLITAVKLQFGPQFCSPECPCCPIFLTEKSQAPSHLPRLLPHQLKMGVTRPFQLQHIRHSAGSSLAESCGSMLICPGALHHLNRAILKESDPIFQLMLRRFASHFLQCSHPLLWSPTASVIFFHLCSATSLSPSFLFLCVFLAEREE